MWLGAGHSGESLTDLFRMRDLLADDKFRLAELLELRRVDLSTRLNLANKAYDDNFAGRMFTAGLCVGERIAGFPTDEHSNGITHSSELTTINPAQLHVAGNQL